MLLFRLKISIFLRSLLAWCDDLPAVSKGSGVWKQGHGRACWNCSIIQGEAGCIFPIRGLSSNFSKGIEMGESWGGGSIKEVSMLFEGGLEKG